MLQKLKMEVLRSQDLQKQEETNLSISRTRIIYFLQYFLLTAIPAGAVGLSLASDNLFLEEVSSAAFLILLILVVRITGGKS